MRRCAGSCSDQALKLKYIDHQHSWLQSYRLLITGQGSGGQRLAQRPQSAAQTAAGMAFVLLGPEDCRQRFAAVRSHPRVYGPKPEGRVCERGRQHVAPLAEYVPPVAQVVDVSMRLAAHDQDVRCKPWRQGAGQPVDLEVGCRQ